MSSSTPSDHAFPPIDLCATEGRSAEPPLPEMVVWGRRWGCGRGGTGPPFPPARHPPRRPDNSDNRQRCPRDKTPGKSRSQKRPLLSYRGKGGDREGFFPKNRFCWWDRASFVPCSTTAPE